jgi:hypothetical protein
VINVHGPMTNPRIYSSMNGIVLPWAFWLDIARSDAAALYAVVAQASVHILMLRNKSPNLDGNGVSGKLNEANAANYYLFKTMRLLQNKIDDPKETLSNATVFVTAVLTACVVSILENIIKPNLSIVSLRKEPLDLSP